MGIGRTKHFLPNLRLVSRAHGYDLYEERLNPPYWPCRDQALALTDFLLPDSDAGAEYLRKRYPSFAERIKTERLGVAGPRVPTQPSGDGVYRIVSCSFLVAVKRIDLFMNGLAATAKLRPDQRFEWCHFGTGPLKSQLEAASRKMPENVKVVFAGYTTQADLFGYYEKNPVDVFVNVSQSEGTPVALMEAISCGIPIIATAVGGNREIVSNNNGILLSATPSDQEVAGALLSHWDQPGERRSGSRMVWMERYDAHKNFKGFSQRLAQIRSQN
jgi:glycosyltransferase involved in cell wall biosynthesis